MVFTITLSIELRSLSTELDLKKHIYCLENGGRNIWSSPPGDNFTPSGSHLAPRDETKNRPKPLTCARTKTGGFGEE
jgi:hypothetical protein